MAFQEVITLSLVRQLLNYDPETGIFVWRHRTENMFCGNVRLFAKTKAAIWNKKHCGKEAGSIGPDGYLRIGMCGKAPVAHRIAWLYVHGRGPQKHLDHINGNRSDNRIANLREANPSQNAQNRAPIKGASKYQGVTFCKQTGKWRACIYINYTRRHLGRFGTQEDAYTAYLEAKKQIHTFNPNSRFHASP